MLGRSLGSTNRTPKVDEFTSYKAVGKVNIYDQVFETDAMLLSTFLPRQITTVSQLGEIESLTDSQGNPIARASLIYSSTSGDDVDYRVVSPDGTCVIGESEEWIVSESTDG